MLLLHSLIISLEVGKCRQIRFHSKNGPLQDHHSQQKELDQISQRPTNFRNLRRGDCKIRPDKLIIRSIRLAAKFQPRVFLLGLQDTIISIAILQYSSRKSNFSLSPYQNISWIIFYSVKTEVGLHIPDSLVQQNDSWWSLNIFQPSTYKVVTPFTKLIAILAVWPNSLAAPT